MNLNLFRKEMRKNALSLILWTTVITLFITVTMSVFPTFIENQSKIMGMLTLIPSGVLQFKGISNFTDFLSPLGFYAVNNIIYMMVLGSIYAIVLSSNIILKEEYNKTAEYLLTRPVTRSEVFLSKSAVIIVNVFVLNLITSVAGLIGVEVVKTGPLSLKAFWILSLYTFLLNLLFGAIGLILSTIGKRSRPITTLSIALVLILYFVFTLSKITGGIAWLGYLSPFKFVNTDVVNPAYQLEFSNLIYFTGTSLVLFLLSFKRYLRRDIYT